MSDPPRQQPESLRTTFGKSAKPCHVRIGPRVLGTPDEVCLEETGLSGPCKRAATRAVWLLGRADQAGTRPCARVRGPREHGAWRPLDLASACPGAMRNGEELFLILASPSRLLFRFAACSYLSPYTRVSSPAFSPPIPRREDGDGGRSCTARRPASGCARGCARRPAGLLRRHRRPRAPEPLAGGGGHLRGGGAARLRGPRLRHATTLRAGECASKRARDADDDDTSRPWRTRGVHRSLVDK